MSTCLKEDGSEDLVNYSQTGDEVQWQVKSCRREKTSRRSSSPKQEKPSIIEKGDRKCATVNNTRHGLEEINDSSSSSTIAIASDIFQHPSNISSNNYYKRSISSKLNDLAWPIVAEGQKMHVLKCSQRRSGDSFAQKLQTLTCWNDISTASQNKLCSPLKNDCSVLKMRSDSIVQTVFFYGEKNKNVAGEIQKKSEAKTSGALPALHGKKQSETHKQFSDSGRNFDTIKNEKSLDTQKVTKKKKGSCHSLKVPPQDYRVCIIDSDQKLKYEQLHLIKQTASEKPPVLQHEKDFPDLSSALKLLSKCTAKGDACVARSKSDSTSAPTCTSEIKYIESKGKKMRKKQPKRRDPISLNIIDIIKESTHTSARSSLSNFRRRDNKIEDRRKLGGNFLDSSNPIRKRGKHRENPPKKRLSKLKNVILNERERKKEQRNKIKSMLNLKQNELTDEHEEESCIKSICDGMASLHIIKEGSKNNEDQSLCDIDQQEREVESTVDELRSVNSHKIDNNDAQCITDTFTANVESGCSFLPDSADPEKLSGFMNNDNDVTQKSKIKLPCHSRKFRDYCDNMRSQELDVATSNFLKEIYRFQDRHYQKDPIRAHAKRRFVLGIREVKKFLFLKKLKAIVIAPDLEPVKASGGLDETIIEIREEGRSQHIPVIFAVGRRQLGFALMKKVPISIIGIINPEGAEELYRQMLEDWQSATENYHVKLLELIGT